MDIVKIVLTVIYVIAALAIITVVLLQEGKSAGLGSLGGGTSSSNNSYWDKNKKHSLEGKFERWTKATAALFVILALVLMILN
ncbi:preprotein translocase subunit SecG [Cellulosilyticum sp. I15G10I2]|uniref:preprotein translocase subunit SecG n=1 Tax=Cellulosilyticum sp. I15G10I2 TaxID=1892843 RepID=UPI00085C5910|nr:preprotein translocase subunit SecG [Cellulosilyticum sp. I15G10I2]